MGDEILCKWILVCFDPRMKAGFSFFFTLSSDKHSHSLFLTTSSYRPRFLLDRSPPFLRPPEIPKLRLSTPSFSPTSSPTLRR
jgi:hypothetical protein